MCGIFGWISLAAPLSECDIESARRATRTLAHRGPDYQGEWFDQRTYMGHRRLSIIDLSTAANQPFADGSGRYRLSYNGEIYNYIELRGELEKLGDVFHTRSDTEVFLAALIRWGPKALTRVDGMFAAALHDTASGEHLLFRDPLGQKPLYYAATSDSVVYASELRALLSLPGRGWRLDRDALQRYLMLGYYACEDSPVQGIRKLMPGCVLRINHDGTRIERYWDSLPGQDEIAPDPDQAHAEFARLFGESCARSMRSDVPYGVFLSGGIDSSLVLSYCRDHNPDVRAVSVAMSEPDFDESAKAASVARRLDVRGYHSFTMDEDAARSGFADVLSRLDEPHADPGFVNAYFLARSARAEMIVALAGDGGDELFAGYAPFAGIGAARWLKSMPGAVPAAVRAAVAMIPANDTYLGLQFKARSFMQGFPAADELRFPLWLSAVAPEELAQLCPSQPSDYYSRQGETGTLFAPIWNVMSPVRGMAMERQLLYYYQKAFLPEFVCMHTDRAAMLSSLEVRSPFLSLPLIEFANRLPQRFKSSGAHLKILLRDAAARRGFSRDIVAQRKQGFTLPLARWLKTSLRPYVEALVNESGWSDGLFDRAELRRHVDDHMKGRRNNYRLLYELIAFRAWRQNYPDVAVS